MGGGSGSAGGTGGSAGGGGTGGGQGPGDTEVCDGVDNDHNGIVDDVDVGKDGVCDCLRVATLGFAGAWGQGNVFSSWLDARSVSGATALEGAVLTSALLERFQVIIVQDVRAGNAGQSGVGNGVGRSYSAEEVEALRQWVAAGGGLMTLTGYADASERTNVNALLAPLGLSYGPNGVLFGGGGATAAVTHWGTHAIADGIMKVGVDNGYPVLGAGTAVAWEPAPGDADVGRAADFEKGRVFVWGDEWITYDSEWTQHADYQVERFWLNTLKWLTPVQQCQVEIPEIG